MSTISITGSDMGRPTLITWTGQVDGQQISDAMAKARELVPGAGIHVRGPGPTAVLDGGGTKAYAITMPRPTKQPPPTRGEPPPPRNRAERRAAGKRTQGV